MSRLVAGAWFGPVLAVLLVFALGLVVGAPVPAGLIGLVVAASLLAGAPAALVVARSGAVLGPLSLALSAAAALGAAGAWLLAGPQANVMIAASLAAAGFAALWTAGGAASARLAWPMPVAALVALCLVLVLRRDAAGVLIAGGLGAAVLGLCLAMPAALTPRRMQGGLRPAGLGLLLAAAVLAGPMSGVAALEQVLALVAALPGLGVLMATPSMAPFRLGVALLLVQALVTFMALLMPGAAVALGLLLAGAVLAGPMSGVAALEQVLALVVALPGLGVLMATPSMAPFRLGVALLLVQALVTFMALLMPGAAVALGLLPAEALENFRWALLGAGFLPVFCALAAALLPRGKGVLALGAFAVLAAGLPLLLGPIGLLAAPILGILLAMLLLLGGTEHAAGA